MTRPIGALLFAAVALAALPMAGQARPRGSTSNALQLKQQIPLENARRIPRDEAIRLVKSGEAVFVDVRSKESFAIAHIKGAISVPQSQLPNLLSTLPPKKMLIAYCACHAEETAAATVLYLNAHGMKNTAALLGGWNEWARAGLPVESSR